MAEAEARTTALQLWAEVEEKRARVAEIHEKIRLLHLSTTEADGLSDEELAAKQAKVREEKIRLARESSQLSSFQPDFSRISEAGRAALAERLREQALEEARLDRLQMDMEDHAWASARLEALARLRIIDFDPKQYGSYYSRFSSFDDPKFDPDKESTIAPMRFTDAVYKSESDYLGRISEGVNILAAKIACSDVGFPIHVYGTVIARDDIDELCVYHFCRDSNHCQLINSEDESLILTGPKRGLATLDGIYVETDLKIKDHLGQDRELSKGVLYIDGVCRSSEECAVETQSLSTRLSTVDVTYSVAPRAVEATIAMEVLKGVFRGKINAYTTNIKDILLLYDSEVAFTLNGDDFGAIRLMRSVISVYLKDMLIVEVHTGDGKSERILFTPRVNGGDEGQITVGATVMRVKVVWSVMDP